MTNKKRTTVNPLQKPGRSLYFHANGHGIFIAVSSKKQSIKTGFRRNFLLAGRSVTYNWVIAEDKSLVRPRVAAMPIDKAKFPDNGRETKWQMKMMVNVHMADVDVL